MGRCGVWSEVEDFEHGYHSHLEGVVGSCSEENDTWTGISFEESSPLCGPRRTADVRSWVVRRIEAGEAVTIAVERTMWWHPSQGSLRLEPFND